MICINPMAPFCDRARNLPSLSTCITVRIQCSGSAKRLDASGTKTAKGLAGEAAAFWALSAARSACAAPPKSINDAKIATKHTIVARIRKRAIVLAVFKVGALTRWPDGRPEPPLSAMAVRTLVRTKEWFVF